MIALVAFIAGAVTGALRARKRGGDRLDQAQWAAGFAIAFGLAGLFATLILGRIL